MSMSNVKVSTRLIQGFVINEAAVERNLLNFAPLMQGQVDATAATDTGVTAPFGPSRASSPRPKPRFFGVLIRRPPRP